MCMFSSGSTSAETVKEYASAKSPTVADTQSASERVSDKISAVPQTQLTDQTDSSLLAVDETGKKKLGA